MNQDTPISAILLAAGESTRMRTQKALLPWRGTTLIQYQVNSLLEAGVSQVVVVLGYRAERLRSLLVDTPGVQTVLNLRYRTGKSSSVRAGVRQVPPDASAALVLSVDQPRSPELVRRVIEAYREKKAPVTYPAYHGRGGHPIIFDGALLPEMARVRESRQGLREVVQHHSAHVNRFTLNDPQILLDFNEPGEYEKAVGV
jgi:molybdenum cofactor cytidylyltransferase